MKRRLTDALPVAAIALILALVVPKLWHQDNASQPRPDSANIPQSRPTSVPTENWKVIRIADGDTITVTRDSLKEKIRFCGIDAPEKSQPLGQESKANLQRLIDEANGEVQLSVIESDRYGRQVAEVFAGGKFLQEEQLKAGLGMADMQYISSCPNKDAILSAEEEARQNKVGVWSSPNYILPWEFRKAQKSGS